MPIRTWQGGAAALYLAGARCVQPADGLHAQPPGRRSSNRGAPWPAVARQCAGESAVGASRMEHLLPPGHGGASLGSRLPGSLPVTLRSKPTAQQPSTLGFINNHWYGQWGLVTPDPATGRPPTAHCFARYSTKGWKPYYATTRARTKPAAMIEPRRQVEAVDGERSDHRPVTLGIGKVNLSPFRPELQRRRGGWRNPKVNPTPVSR